MRTSFLGRVIGILMLSMAWGSSARAGDVLHERAPLFAYEAAAPFDVKGKSSELCGMVCVDDISFAVATASERWTVNAYLVAPSPEDARPCAGVLWVHWLGDPATTSRVQFLDEAVALAERGVVSVLVDAMWAKPKWYRDRVLEEDYAHSVKQVIALRRALDLVRAQPRVDSARIGLVAHDYGAMYGTLALALDGRMKAAVLIAATPSFNDWAFFVKKPTSMDEYLRQNAPLEIVDYLGALRGPSLFMQFAGRDEYVPVEKAEAFFAAANEPKQKRVYPEAGHEMTQPAEIRADRTAWLVRELGLR
ncbi:MAG: hypothetical protein IAE82_04305 [Opitutaceae bacterium]|nr:hypothetical protein [Opitutaceae bacterium]